MKVSNLKVCYQNVLENCIKSQTTVTLNWQSAAVSGQFKTLLSGITCYLFFITISSYFTINVVNRIGDVMVSVLASSVVDPGFEPRSGHTKDYKIGVCCFSAKHAALRRKSKDWSARNQNNVSEWRDMSTRELLFQ